MRWVIEGRDCMASRHVTSRTREMCAEVHEGQMRGWVTPWVDTCFLSLDGGRV